VLAVPAPFTYNSMSVVITADKQSNLYVSDRGNLGKFSPGPSPACPSTPNNIQCLLSPHNAQNQKLAPTQGYWGSPAFWHYNDGTDRYMLYYSPTVETAKPNDDSDKAPYPLYGFQLNTSSTSGPPIPDPATTSTLNVKFCPRSPTPTVSSNGSLDPASGIVWAIEHQNRANANNQCNLAEYPGAALHAFKATDLTAPELYSSRHNNPQGAIGGEFTKFSTPTVFNGQVYVGTQGEVDVYGLCPQGGCH